MSKIRNPKEITGGKKASLSSVSGPVLFELGLAMLDGALKHGRHNYRDAGGQASVYYDAAQRHLMDWWEGQDIDTESGMSHVTKAIASLVVLRDLMIFGKLVDDRPPPAPQGWLAEMHKIHREIVARYPNPTASHTRTHIGKRARRKP